MDSIEKQMAELSVQFSSLSVELEKLQPKIERAEGEVLRLLGGDDPFENERFKYWREEKTALHEEKAALLKKEVALIQKETVSETALHQKEHDLLKKEVALIQKETVSETALHQKEHDLHEEKMALAPKEGLSEMEKMSSLEEVETKKASSLCKIFCLFESFYTLFCVCFEHSMAFPVQLLPTLTLLFSMYLFVLSSLFVKMVSNASCESDECYVQ